MTVAQLSEKSSVTVAIAASLMIGAFYTGGAFADLRYRVNGVESRQAEYDERQVNVDQILAELRDITKDHERRLNATNR